MAQEFNYALRATELFKDVFGPLSRATYNSANVMLARVKKTWDFGGRKMYIAVPLTFQGGVGSSSTGALPTANAGEADQAGITRTKMYSVVTIDRETIHASKGDANAFVNSMKHVAAMAVESFNRNLSRCLFGDGTGALGNVSDLATDLTGAGTTGDPYVLTIDTNFKEANFEERLLVNIDSETTLLEIVAVVPSTRKVSLVGSSSTLSTGTATDVKVYQQGSKDNDPEGLKGVLDATSGSKYEIPIARRWQATQINASAAVISSDIINQAMLTVEKKTGKVPNMIVTSFLQFELLSNALEDKKSIQLKPRYQEGLSAVMGFKTLAFDSRGGLVPVVPERFVENDRCYVLNDEHITIMHAPGFGWMDDDGTVFSRVNGYDHYEARYGGYLQIYIVPTFHAVITNLKLTA